MFIAILLAIVKNYTGFKCLSGDEWISMFWFICTMECYLVTKRRRPWIQIAKACGSQDSDAV